MLALCTLREIPDELANRMMVAHGSRMLLRALRGEPEPETVVEPRVRPPRPPQAPKAPRPMLHPVVPGLASAEIIDWVAEPFGLTPAEITGRERSTAHVLARSIVIKLMRERKWINGEPRFSLPMIGRTLGRDHSTICHALETFDDRMERFPEAYAIYVALQNGGGE